LAVLLELSWKNGHYEADGRHDSPFVT